MKFVWFKTRFFIKSVYSGKKYQEGDLSENEKTNDLSKMRHVFY